MLLCSKIWNTNQAGYYHIENQRARESISEMNTEHTVMTHWINLVLSQIIRLWYDNSAFKWAYRDQIHSKLVIHINKKKQNLGLYFIYIFLASRIVFCASWCRQRYARVRKDNNYFSDGCLPTVTVLPTTN